RLRSEELPQALPRRAALRPVEAYPVAHRAAEQLVDRHAERLGLDVPQGQLDAGHRLVRDAPAVLAHAPQHVPVEALDRPRVLPDQEIGDGADRPGDAAGTPVV